MSAEAGTGNQLKMTGERIRDLAKHVLRKATEEALLIATAESCTGGLLAAELTAIPGCSSVFERGFVTYSNEAKAEMLGVDPALIGKYGAVSKEVATAMAEGALKRSRASLSVAITGIAGPDGGNAEKPVGLVHFAAAKLIGRDGDRVEFATIHSEERFGDIGRAEVCTKSVETALRLLLEAADLSQRC
jgi:nicotinamide-nucleotide amidase